MRKKASPKNREWEKGRRDRLNTAFDTLAKLLPHFATNLSKIEIIERAIRFVNELQANVKMLTNANNSTILKTQEELEEGFKALVVRNSDLVALLKKHMVAVPPYNPPHGLSYVVQQDNADGISENDCNGINVQTASRTSKHSRQFSDISDNTKSSGPIATDDLEKKILATNKLEGDPVTHQALDTQNKVIPQPLITARLVPIKVIKVPVLRPVSIVRKGGKMGLRLIRPAAPGIQKKVPIPRLKRNIEVKKSVTKSSNRNRRKKKISVVKKSLDRVEKKLAKTSDTQLPNDETNNVESISKPNSSVEQSVKNSQCNENTVTLPNSSCMFSATTTEANITNEIFENTLSTQQSAIPKISLVTPNEMCNQSEVMELPNDLLLESLAVPQQESNNPGSLSPTAAYLMSFPVVSGGHRIEDNDRTTSEVCPSPVKPDHHNILENISSLLTTRDYDRFVGTTIDDKAPEKASKTFEFELKPLPQHTGTSENHLNHRNLVESASFKEHSTPTIESGVAQEIAKSMSICGQQNLPQEDESSGMRDKTNDKFNLEPFVKENPSGFTFSLTATTNSFVPSSRVTASGFYDSLNNIGSTSSTHRSDTMISNHYNMVPLLSNLYLNPTQTSTSSAYSSVLDINQPAFTFSLTPTTQTTPNIPKTNVVPCTPPHTFSISTVAPTTTLSTPKSNKTSTTNSKPNNNQPIVTTTSTLYQQKPYGSINNNTPISSSNLSSYGSHHHTYNPFAFDNVQTTKDSQFTFSLTNTTNSFSSSSTTKRKPPHPPSNPFSIDFNILSEQKQTKRTTLPFGICSAVTPIPSSQSFPTDHDPIQFYPSKHQMYHQQPHFSSQPEPLKADTHKSKSHHKSHVNWMTSSGDNFNPIIPPSLPNIEASLNFNSSKPMDLNYNVHPVGEDSFNWSPNKLMLDNANSTLPNLHGDLALNNFISRPHLSSISSTKRSKKPSSSDPIIQPIIPSSNINNNNNNNSGSFTVSHLVDQRKPEVFSNNHVESKTTTTKISHPKENKRSSVTSSIATHSSFSSFPVVSSSSSFNYSSNIFVDSFTNPCQSKPIITSHSKNYSAEALLSNTSSVIGASSASFNKRDKYLGNYFNINTSIPSSSTSVGEYYHPEVINTTTTNNNNSISIPSDFSDPFYIQPNCLASQKPHCQESDYLGASITIPKSATNNTNTLFNPMNASYKSELHPQQQQQHRPDIYNHQHQQPTHVYPFNPRSSSSTQQPSTKTQKPIVHNPAKNVANSFDSFDMTQKYHVANSFDLTPKNTSFDSTTSTNYYQPPLLANDTSNLHSASTQFHHHHHHNRNHHQNAADHYHQSYHHPHYNHHHHQSITPNTTVAATSILHENYHSTARIVGAPGATAATVYPTHHFDGGGSGSTTTADPTSGYPATINNTTTNPSHLVSDFNLSTICPEINQDKVVQQTIHW